MCGVVFKGAGGDAHWSQTYFFQPIDLKRYSYCPPPKAIWCLLVVYDCIVLLLFSLH